MKDVQALKRAAFPSLACLSAALLVGCGTGHSPSSAPLSPPSASQPPVTVKGGPLIEVTFENANGLNAQPSASAMNASARVLDGSLGAQGFTGGSQAFSFRLLSSRTFKGGGTRHIRATFEVTNNTGAALIAPTFLAVNTDPDSDPATPDSTTPTVGATPFKDLQRFDGTDASSKAASLTLVSPKDIDPQSGGLMGDANATPLLSGLDVSGLTPPAPAGLTANVLPLGWELSSTLAAGAKANVTFAVDLPADAVASNDPFRFSLLVMAASETASLRSAVKQLDPLGKTFKNYTRFPVAGGRSLPAYYDVNAGAGVSAVLCPGDSNVTVTGISDAAHPNRYRVEVATLGDHVLNVFLGTSCPASGSATGTPIATQNIVGVAARGKTLHAAPSGGFNLAVMQDGTVTAWGTNSLGQLGNGTTSRSEPPGPVSNLSNVVGVDSGNAHSVALKGDGTVWVWGLNQGRFGDGTQVPTVAPVQVPDVQTAVGVSATAFSTQILLSDGTVMSASDPGGRRLGRDLTLLPVAGLQDVVALSGGDNHLLALLADGTVRAWGDNSFGQIGNGTTAFATDPVPVSNLTNVSAIDAGAAFSLAWQADGQLQTWGANHEGQLGHTLAQTTVTTPKPAAPAEVTPTLVTRFSGGTGFVLTLNQLGNLNAWGRANEGQLHTNSSGSLVVGIQNATDVAAGQGYALALMPDGTIKAWGKNTNGELGVGNTDPTTNIVSTLVSGVAQP